MSWSELLESLVHVVGLFEWKWSDAAGSWSRWSVAERTVGAARVVVPPPGLDDGPCLLEGVEDLRLQALVLQPAVKASQQPFSQGLPGAMNSCLAPSPASQVRITLAVISGPLSDLMF